MLKGNCIMLRRAFGKLRKPAARFGKNEKGAAAVEFALISVPFFYILGTIVEAGLMLFTEYTLQASVQEASRLIRTGQMQKTGMSDVAFKAKVCETAGILINCMGQATVYVDSRPSFAALDTNTPDMEEVGPDGTAAFTAGGASSATAVIVTYDWDFVLPFMSFFGNVDGGSARRLVGFAMFRNEPYS
jgi:Flp pilus assembly protein TadG